MAQEAVGAHGHDAARGGVQDPDVQEGFQSAQDPIPWAIAPANTTQAAGSTPTGVFSPA